MKKHAEHFFLLGLSFVAFLLRFPSLFEPYWYGDEGIYQVIGRAMRNGEFLYRDIWDNKPPLLYLIYALVNGDQFWARMLSIIFLLGGVVAFYYLAKKLFTKFPAVIWSTIFFTLLFSLPILEGNIANAENFMLLPIILSALLVFNYHSKPTTFNLLLAGFLLSLAFLIKIVAVFDFAAFLLFLIFLSQWKLKAKYILMQGKKILQESYPLLIGFFLPIILTAGYFAANGVFADFLAATFSQNVGYVGYRNPLLIKLLLLGLFVILLFWQRQKFSKTQIFILLLLGFSIFNAFFAGRPWTHYLLVLIPSFSLLAGLLIEDKNKRFLYAAIMILVIVIISGHFWIYGKTVFYYQNFLSFILGKQSTSSYQNFFAPHVKRDYIVAQFLRGKILSSDNIFLWGDNAQLYMLVGKLPPGRYTVAYHITFYPQAVQETGEDLKRKKPKYIVTIKDISTYEELLNGYKLVFVIEGANIYERSYRLP